MPATQRTTTKAARWAFAVWLVVIAVAVLQPHPTIATGLVDRVASLLTRVDVPRLISDPAHVEALLNGGMFLPAAALALLSWPRLHWCEVVVVGFGGSLAIELVQYFFLDARSAQAVDVVANTVGSLAGAILGELVRRRLRRISAAPAASQRSGQSRP